jgi:1-phosphatidylinositol phosphodiesterase
MSYSTYRTGLQFDNKTPLSIVSGTIVYDSDHIAPITDRGGIEGFFTDTPTKTVAGSRVTLSGPMDIQPGKYVDKFIEVYENWGQEPIVIQLNFSNGHSIKFGDVQRVAYDEVSGTHPLPVAVEQPAGPGVTDRMGVAYWTRHDLKEKYKYGLVSYVIHDRSLTARWMGTLDPRRKISEITLPGTHDSATWTMSGNAQCQTHDIRQQLDAGIRFLDIRLQKTVVARILKDNHYLYLPDLSLSPDLEIYHGLVAAGLEMKRDIVPACKAFLAQNPSETIVMMISRNRVPLEEGDEYAANVAAKSDSLFVANVDRLIGDPVFLRQSTIPTLGQAKGHVVVMTRYTGGPGIPWQTGQPDNSEDSVNEAGNRFYIQDAYQYPTTRLDQRGEMLDAKWAHIKSNLDDASLKGLRDGTWWINYASATGLLYLDPVDFARGTAGMAGMNSRVRDYLKSHNKGYYGTVPMDFPDLELIEQLIATNR